MIIALGATLTPITAEGTRAEVSKLLSTSFNLLLAIKGAVLAAQTPLTINHTFTEEALCLT